MKCEGLKRKSSIASSHPVAWERHQAKLVEKFSETIPDGPDAKNPPAPENAPTPEKYPLKFHGDPDNSPLKEWLLHQTLPAKGVALLSGQSGSYKTFLAIDLSVAVMTKSRFAHRDVKRQGGVLFIAAEVAGRSAPAPSGGRTDQNSRGD